MANAESVLQELIYALHNAREKKTIHELLKNCIIPDGEWSRYAFISNAERDYSRNLIYECERFRLILICWNPGRGNKRHDHSQSDCYFKVLRGEMHEEQYEPNHQPKSDKTYRSRPNQDDVCHLEYLSGTQTHSMKNCDDKSIAVTLHLYMPPFDRCVVYDNEGTCQHVDLTFVSRFGFATERETTLMNIGL